VTGRGPTLQLHTAAYCFAAFFCAAHHGRAPGQRDQPPAARRAVQRLGPASTGGHLNLPHCGQVTDNPEGIPRTACKWVFGMFPRAQGHGGQYPVFWGTSSCGPGFSSTLLLPVCPSNGCCQLAKTKCTESASEPRSFLKRNYNSSWMLRVLGKFMGPSDLRERNLLAYREA
jgi:hypothetical protein